MLNLFILALSLVGLWISVYFTAVFYKWCAPDVFWIPKVCRLKEQTCMTILDTPRAKLFGIPNSVFGIGVYSYLILNLFLPFSWTLALVLLLFAVFRSMYLAYSLLYVTKIPCPLCFTSHFINLILFILVFKMTVSG